MTKVDRVLLVVAAALGMAAPMWFILWCIGGLNDKPHGHHPVPTSYLLTGLAAAAAAVLAWWLTRLVANPNRFAGVYGLIAALLACFLLVSFFLWWMPSVLEFRDRQGRPIDPPAVR